MFKKKVEALFRRGEEAAVETGEVIQNNLHEIARDAEALADDVKMEAEVLKDNAKDAGRITFEEVSEKLKIVSETLKEKANELKAKAYDVSRDEAAGKYLTVNILSKNDEILANRGDMITYDLLNRAEAEGKLDQVLRHTSKEPLL